MATRFYMPSSGAAGSSPTARADWERSIGAAAHRPALTTKSNTALTDVAAVFGSTATGQTRWMSFVSNTLNVDQTITGTFSMVVRGLEGSTSEDAHVAYMLRVMQGNTSTERGLLASSMTTVTEFTASAQTRIFSAIAVSSVAALAGDRIVLEIGIHGVTPANSNNITLRFGDPTATADFALTSGLTTDLCPWFELSQNLTFGIPALNITTTPGNLTLAGTVATVESVTPYSAAVMATNPLAYWRLNETSGTTAFDSSGNGLHATNSGATVNQAGLLVSEADTAYSFDGTDDNVSLANAAFNTSQATVRAWVKTAATTGVPTIFQKDAHYAVYLINGVITAYDYGNDIQYSTGVNIADNVTRMVELKFDEDVTNGSRILVNGVVIWTGTLGATSITLQGISIGRNWNAGAGGTALAAIIDEVTVWDTILSDADSLDHYEIGLGGAYLNAVLADSPIAFWRFGEASGSVVDSSGNGTPASNPDVVYGQAGALSGDADTSYGFNGTSSKVNNNNVSVLDDTAYSMEIWAYVTRAHTSGLLNGYFYVRGASTNSDLIGVMGTFFTEADRGKVFFKNAATWVMGTTILALNEWYYIGFSRNGNGVKVYVGDDAGNFAKEIDTTLSADYGTSDVVTIGVRSDHQWWFQGRLDEFGLYNGELAETQFQNHYNAGLGITETGLDITTTPGDLSLAGTSATLTGGMAVAATAGSASLEGTSATLTGGMTVTSTAGSMALAGTATSLTGALTVTASPGDMALAGTAATMVGGSGLNIATSPGSMALAGEAATLTGGMTVTSAGWGDLPWGEFPWGGASTIYLGGTVTTITSEAAAGLDFTATVGGMSLAGTAATLTGGFEIAATAGDAVLAGTIATLAGGMSVSAAAGDTILAGESATLTGGMAVAATAGDIALAGEPATFAAGMAVAATAGDIALAGTSATLAGGMAVSAVSGDLSLSGTLASITAGMGVATTPGDLSLSGELAGLTGGLQVDTFAGDLILSGTEIAFASITQVFGGVTFSIPSDFSMTIVADDPAMTLSTGGDPVAMMVAASSDPAGASISTGSDPASISISQQADPVAVEIAVPDDPIQIQEG